MGYGSNTKGEKMSKPYLLNQVEAGLLGLQVDPHTKISTVLFHMTPLSVVALSV